jgi:hypothetical protein
LEEVCNYLSVIEYGGGKIDDIEKGKDFDCKLWLEGPNKSEVR